MTTSTDTINLEWHQLELRYQLIRIHAPGSIRRLMLSIHARGLQVPITVVASGIPDRPWVVIDGYSRILALQAQSTGSHKCFFNKKLAPKAVWF